MRVYDLTKESRLDAAEQLAAIRESLETLNIILMGAITKQTIGRKL